MGHLHYIVISYAISINGLAYLLMCVDKYRSKKGGSRIPENTLFLLAFFCGAPGIYSAMKAPLYHKASKTKFKLGIPVLIVFNILFICFLFV